MSTALLIIFWIVTGLVAGHRAKKGSNDFDTFYAAGRAILTHQGIYYQNEFYKDSEKVSPFLYPPAAACFFSLFAAFPLKPSAFLWNTFNLSLFIASLILTVKILDPSPKDLCLRFCRLPIGSRIVFTVLALSMLMDNLAMAQVNILIFFLILTALCLMKSRQDFWAGAVLSVAILIKVTPALFALYFLLKRNWKALGGLGAGAILLTVMIPTLFFGWPQNRLVHRQWMGRAIKPILIPLIALFEKDNTHPMAKSAEKIRAEKLGGSLAEKNQALEASLTRLFLKNRNSFAYDAAFPMYAARRYEKLPVLFGGVDREILAAIIRTLQAGILIFLIYLWSPRRKGTSPALIPFEISLIFLSMTLISPLARSHQFVSWIFPYATVLWAQTRYSNARQTRGLSAAMLLSFIFYVLQALPYGKAAGMGTWANLSLWMGFALILTLSNRWAEQSSVKA